MKQPRIGAVRGLFRVPVGVGLDAQSLGPCLEAPPGKPGPSRAAASEHLGTGTGRGGGGVGVGEEGRRGSGSTDLGCVVSATPGAHPPSKLGCRAVEFRPVRPEDTLIT